MPEFRIVGVSLEEIGDEEFREFAEEACREFARHAFSEEDWERLRPAPLLRAALGRARGPRRGGRRGRRRARRRDAAAPLPQRPARRGGRRPADARRRRPHRGARVIMEKPFGTDLASARRLNDDRPRGLARGPGLPHRPLPRQGGGAEHPRPALRQRPLRADLEPRPHRPHPDRRAGDARRRLAAPLLRADRRLPRHGRHPPDADPRLRRDGAADRAGAGADHRGEEQGLPLAAAARPGAGRARPVRGLPRPSPASTPTPAPRPSSPCAARSTTGAGAACPFFLRTGKRMGESARIISIAFREPPQSMFPADSRVGRYGPDHLTFDLDESSRVSLSFYGKRPGMGMVLDKASMQFSLDETDLPRRHPGGLRAADPRRDGRRPHPVHDRRRTSSGSGRSRRPLLESPPPVKPYPPGSWGPAEIGALIAPREWRLPFARRWRDARCAGRPDEWS